MVINLSVNKQKTVQFVCDLVERTIEMWVMAFVALGFCFFGGINQVATVSWLNFTGFEKSLTYLYRKKAPLSVKSNMFATIDFASIKYAL
jgi:hypothetical protein